MSRAAQALFVAKAHNTRARVTERRDGAAAPRRRRTDRVRRRDILADAAAVEVRHRA